MLDDLRDAAERSDFDDFDEVDDDFSDFDFEGTVIDDKTGEPARFLGMTALERMLLSIFLFLNVTVLGLALLIATQRLSF